MGCRYRVRSHPLCGPLRLRSCSNWRSTNRVLGLLLYGFMAAFFLATFFLAPFFFATFFFATFFLATAFFAAAFFVAGFLPAALAWDFAAFSFFSASVKP